MAMRTRNDFYNCDTRIDSKRLVPASRLVSAVTGMQVQRNKAIVGRNAFAHEAGIHQDGMLKERSTYEIMRPEDVGFAATDLVLGKHSGRAALADRAKQLGFHITGEQLQQVFLKFKKLADRKKEVFDGDIVALVQNEILSDATEREWMLVTYTVELTYKSTPKISLTLKRGEEEKSVEVCDGSGVVDAAFLAVQQITGIQLDCKEFQIQSSTLGRDETECEGEVYRGRAVSMDCVEASIKAILNATNRIVASSKAGV
jgi:2-isopropylmalate synthase